MENENYEKIGRKFPRAKVTATNFYANFQFKNQKSQLGLHSAEYTKVGQKSLLFICCCFRTTTNHQANSYQKNYLHRSSQLLNELKSFL